MNDTLYEQTIKHTLSKKEKIENLGILVSGIIGIIVSLVVLGGFFFIAFTVIILIEYFVLLPRRSIEVEYSFFDQVLEISYIYNKEKRKTKLEIDMRNVETIAPTDSDEIRVCHPQKVMDFSSGEENRETYSIMGRMGSQLTQVIVEPDEKLLLPLIKAVRM